MRRILLTAPDYGLAFGVDRAQRELVAAGLLSAVGCMVVSDLWTREYLPLRDTVDDARHETLVGLTVTLCGPHMPLSDAAQEQFGDTFPGPFWWRWRSALRLLPEEVLAAEVDAQFHRFEDYYQRPAEFVHVADDLMAVPRLARVVLRQASQRAVPPQVIAPDKGRRGLRAVRRAAEALDLDLRPRGPGFPFPAGEADLRAHVWRGLNGVPDGAAVMCQPGEADDRLRRSEPPVAQEARAELFGFLKSEEFSLLLVEKDIFLY